MGCTDVRHLYVSRVLFGTNAKRRNHAMNSMSVLIIEILYNFIHIKSLTTADPFFLT